MEGGKIDGNLGMSYSWAVKDLSYSGSAAVVNSEGKLLFYCGEPPKNPCI